MESYCNPLPAHLCIGNNFALSTFVCNLFKLMNKIPICPLPFDSLQPKGLPTTAFAFSLNTLLSSGCPLLFTYVLKYIKTYYNSVPTFRYSLFSPNNSAPLLVLSSLFDGAKVVRYF